MEARLDHSSGEIRRLQRCISDLVGLLALPAIWTGGDVTLIGRTLLDALREMLDLDLVYVRMRSPSDEVPLEMARVVADRGLPTSATAIGDQLRGWLGDGMAVAPRTVLVTIGGQDLSVAPLRLGLQEDLGMLVAASRRPDFPGQTDRLLLNVAANHAALGLREAHLLAAQRRLAGELDRRVADRTRELARANAELRNEVAERRAVEDRLRWEERQLKQSEARKAAILDSALECIVTIDHEGRITEFNPAAERTFGYARDHAIGSLLADLIVPPEQREAHRLGFVRYLTTGESRLLGRRLEMIAMRADGSRFPVELSITRIPVDGPPSFTGYLRDITERREYEASIRRSEAFLAEAQRLSLTGSFSWRLPGDEISWSEQLYRIFGFEPGSAITLERIASRVHPDDRAVLGEMVLAARTSGRDFEFEHRIRLPDDSIRHLHLVAHAIPGPSGELEYIGAVQDVTDRRQSELALSKARSDLAHVTRVTTLGALTASIAHEVNQPLSGIITNAGTCLRMLAADPPNVEGARETARRTIRDGNRASEVITRLRGLFSGKDIASEPLDLNEAAREVLALSLGELQQAGVVSRLELAEDLPTVHGDRVQLQQVMLNLVRNAADAMAAIEDRPRQLLIRTAHEGSDAVRLMVEDSGVGIDPEQIEHLFDAFYTTKEAGMGVGLSVSRSIIDRHQGRLWATPNRGPGATFGFTVPCLATGRSP